MAKLHLSKKRIKLEDGDVSWIKDLWLQLYQPDRIGSYIKHPTLQSLNRLNQIDFMLLCESITVL